MNKIIILESCPPIPATHLMGIGKIQAKCVSFRARLVIFIGVRIWKALPIFHAILNDFFAEEFILYLEGTTLVAAK